MPLDFLILAENGTPRKTVPLAIDLHHTLMIYAAENRLAAILVFGNYYEDVEVAPENLSTLYNDVCLLTLKVEAGELKSFLGQLMELIDHALAHKLTLHAIAD